LTEQIEYLERFGYRAYDGDRVAQWRKIISLIWFEVTSTWHRSTLGKVILIIVLVVNAITVILSSFSYHPGFTDEEKIKMLTSQVASYFSFFTNTISPFPDEIFFSIGVNGMGLLLLVLFGIAGSGMFADDKHGNVVEIYMTKLKKSYYVIGKIGAIMLYSNLFICIPILALVGLQAQAMELNHFSIMYLYLGIIVFSLLLSLIIGLAILTMSILVEKRNYASLGFFLIYIIASIFGQGVAATNRENHFLLLISPDTFLILLAYILVGNFTLGVMNFSTTGPPVINPLNLHNGEGLEYYHVLLVALGYIVTLSSILAYKIKKLTTEEL
jgi:hypothetical protein